MQSHSKTEMPFVRTRLLSSLGLVILRAQASGMQAMVLLAKMKSLLQQLIEFSLNSYQSRILQALVRSQLYLLGEI